MRSDIRDAIVGLAGICNIIVTAYLAAFASGVPSDFPLITTPGPDRPVLSWLISGLLLIFIIEPFLYFIAARKHRAAVGLLIYINSILFYQWWNTKLVSNSELTATCITLMIVVVFDLIYAILTVSKKA